MSKKLLLVMLVVLVSGVTAQATIVDTYEADVMPASDGWGNNGNEVGSIVSGVYTRSNPDAGYARYYKTIVTDNHVDDDTNAGTGVGSGATFEGRWKSEAGKENDYNQLEMIVKITDTAYTSARLDIKNGSVVLSANSSAATVTMDTTDAFHTYRVVLGYFGYMDGARGAKLYIDGSTTAAATVLAYGRSGVSAEQLKWGNNSNAHGEGFELDYFRFKDLELDGTTAVPEPATLAILGLGSLILRRKRA